MTRMIGASQSGTLDGGPVTWTPPGVSGFARDSRPRGTRIDFDVKVIEVPQSTSSWRFRLVKKRFHEGAVPVTTFAATGRGLRELNGENDSRRTIRSDLRWLNTATEQGQQTH